MAPRLPFLWGGAQGFCGGSVIITPYWWCSLCSLRTTTDEDRGSDDCTALHCTDGVTVPLLSKG